MSERLTSSLTQNGKQPVVLSNRNVVINGAMQVAQRGTSVAADNYGAVDRWATTAGGGLGAFTQSQEADAPTGSGFRNSYKLLFTTADASPAASDSLQLQQRLEGQNVQQFLKGTASAKPFSVSFWVKANVTGTYIAELVDADNSRAVSASYTISTSATWEKKTITFPADTTGAFDNDNARSLDIRFWLGAGTNWTSGTLATTWVSSATSANRAVGQLNLAATLNNYWQVTGVQLEVGSVATPFEFEDFGVTLQKCKRYYEKTYEYASAPGTATNLGYVGWGGPDSLTVLYVFPTWRYSVEKRGTPTTTVYDTAGNSGKITTWQTGLGTNNVTPSSASWVTGTTQTSILASGSISGIQFHAVAIAEL